MIKISLSYLHPAWQRLFPYAHDDCHQLALGLGKILGQHPSGEIGIALADGALMRELNLRYRGRAYAANVLSFHGAHKDELGEIVIGLEPLLRECHLYRMARQKRFCWLVAHGMLHLCGFSHSSTKQERIMQKLEQSLLESINVC